MPSIILSFVGRQDPVSDSTREEGSILTLLHYLVSEEPALRVPSASIKKVVLLYTTDTRDRAELTQGWLMDSPFRLPESAIALVPVDVALSHDPVNITLAVQAARQGLEIAISEREKADKLELNASSGTPVMKSAWSILQAAGYAPNSRVWQIRNPKEQGENQERVFQSNLQILKLEFELKIIKQQLHDYNYGGALTSLKASGLQTTLLEALLQYGHRRLSLDFRGAKQAIAGFKSDIATEWYSEIDSLNSQNDTALLQETYFNAVIELKNQRFSNFLVRVSQFQEKTLQYYVSKEIQLRLPNSFEETKLFWCNLRSSHPELFQFLNNLNKDDNQYIFKLDGFPNRSLLLAILEYKSHPLSDNLQRLNSYCEKRNRYLHRFEGISRLDDAPDILKVMRSILGTFQNPIPINPFTKLNHVILSELNKLT